MISCNKTYFLNLGITNLSNVKFCDDPLFVELCEKRPAYNEEFAVYVNEQDYPKEYLNRARRLIPIIVDTLWEELNADGELGTCARISLQLYRMLQEAGFWCYMIKGALKVEIDSNEKYGFYGLQSTTGSENKEVGHIWVVAPPFKLIDISVKRQEYLSSNTNVVNNLLQEQLTYGGYILEDIISPSLLKEWKSAGYEVNMNNIYCNREGWNFFSDKFRPFKVFEKNIEYRYTPLNIYMVSDELDDIYWHCNGKSARYIYDNLILPKIQAP